MVELDPLSAEHAHEQAKTLSDLHNEPASPDLQAYFKSLKIGSFEHNEDAFIKGGERFAKLCQSVKYYDKPGPILPHPPCIAVLGIKPASFQTHNYLCLRTHR